MKSKSNRPQRRLIVNADDFGLSPGVNAAVAQSHRHGILTSASILANAPAFAAAAALAAENPGLGVGVHLNIVRGRPLSRPDAVPLLADGAGEFRRFRHRRMTSAFLAQAGAEYRLQIEKVLAAGIRPTHVDFEKHHAWQGPLYRLACRLAGEYGIRAARTLREPVAWACRNLGWPGCGRAAQAALLRGGFALGGGGRQEEVAVPDRLLGQTHIGMMREGEWLKLLANLPGGVSEVMTHPGLPEETRDAPWGSWLDQARAAELQALLSPQVADAIRKHTIKLVTFHDLLGSP